MQVAGGYRSWLVAKKSVKGKEDGDLNQGTGRIFSGSMVGLVDALISGEQKKRAGE